MHPDREGNSVVFLCLLEIVSVGAAKILDFLLGFFHRKRSSFRCAAATKEMNAQRKKT